MFSICTHCHDAIISVAKEVVKEEMKKLKKEPTPTPKKRGRPPKASTEKAE